ncbi:GumC family protein [Salipiger mangrovisoli]|uniref:Lipopolysaccharide biosynthesis protein n=1 Tax=Salipiger mangrovisoli TaxID=2865933 RepID=A0ABR9X9Z5_9RHOB|nr:Wzz/FepE/Etk N-terminal domain-containing protein [Salipiger mangrovisoli]MBE9640440.1 lipopolysaccharide biosynthesis protein [Salipiger mangrovisoli]
MDFGYYWKIFRRRLPYLVILAAFGAALGVAVALTLRPVYESKATLIVESEQIPGNLAATTVQTGEMEALQIIRQRILSREVLLELSNRLNIYSAADAMSPDEKVTDMRARIGIVTVGGQNTRGPRDATIVTVSFSANSARLAAETANEIVTLILQQNVEMRTAVARQTLDFFTQEVKRLEAELSRVSAQILEFQENNLESLPESLDFRRGQQAALQERQVQLEREKTALQERRERLVTLFQATGRTNMSASGIAAAAPRSPEEARLADLRAQHTQLSAVLSDNNPRMAVLRSQIAAAEEALARRPASPPPDSQEGSALPQLETSLFDIQMADLDAQIAYIETQQSSAETRMEEIRQTIEQTPANAITLASLERTHANLQQQYNTAVANKARAETGSMIESMSRGQRISVVEQAVPPSRPTSPNRPLISAVGLTGGLTLGLLLVALMEVTNSAVRRPKDIRAGLGIETFATIPYMVTQREHLRRRTITLSAALVLMVGIPGGLWYIDQHVTPLQSVVERVLDKVNLGHLI